MNFNSAKNSKSLLQAFISRYTTEDFFCKIANITLYPADFGNFTYEGTTSVIDYFQRFLKVLNENVRKSQVPNSKMIQIQIQSLISLLTIREASASVLNYDNAQQHLVSKDLVVTKLLQKVNDERINSTDEFRKITNEITDTIHSYYEVISASSTFTMIDSLKDSVENLSPFEAIKSYKDLIIGAYNELTKMQSLLKAESESDYFVISDNDSCQKLSKTLVNYVSQGFSVFKTGYDLFDKILDGVESSSVHLLSAASNNGKSIFTINLCKNIIEVNLNDFDKNDCILFVTLEDKKLFSLNPVNSVELLN